MYAMNVGGLAIRGESDVLLSLYRQNYRTQDVSMKTCKIEGCERKYWAKGYCTEHYQRFKAHGDPLFTKIEMHGMRHIPEYQVWANMKDRCYNKNNKLFHRYGGRGIIVCERWIDSFLAFFTDMGLKPFQKAQIDRVDNDGNYEPSNCKYATHKENTRHTSTTKLTMQIVKEIREIYKTGKTSCKKLAVLYGISYRHVRNIVSNKRWV